MTAETSLPSPEQSEQVMRLRYGLSEKPGWSAFALGPQRQQLWTRLAELGSHVVRIFVFDKSVPDPLAEWEPFASWVQAVLNTGAVPMVTFAKFGPPYDDPAGVRSFSSRCATVAARCVEQWGTEVRDWYWCVWDQPNSEWISAGMSFEDYCHIYVEVAGALASRLAVEREARNERHEASENAGAAGNAPRLSPLGPRPSLLIGGPAIDGFQPFWSDWIWRFVNEVDNALIGFVSWHCFGDWREPGTWGAPADETVFQRLLLARTAEYESRARAIAALLAGRNILNVCSALNAHAHSEPRVSRRYNQTVFGAAFYTSALLNLMRGGADVEMRWTGTDDAGPYGLIDSSGTPTPVFHAKRLFARHIRFGDRIFFPATEDTHPGMDVVVAHGSDGRGSVLLVHRKDQPATYAVADLARDWLGGGRLLKIDESTENRVLETAFGSAIAFAGYGVAVLTTDEGGATAKADTLRVFTRPSPLAPRPSLAPCPLERRMRLRYGLNEADCWWHFAVGPQRERLWARLRELTPRIIRIFLFDKGTPDPEEDWQTFIAYVQAVLNVGAVPMITFAKCNRPYDDPRAVRWFAGRCADVVWNCIERWGGEVVRDWYWCVWNEPNSTWIGGGLSFEHYRRVYEEVAHGIRRWLAPHLGERRLPLGGPSVEGFDPFWLDWIRRFVHEIDPALIGFVNWHRYADWRDHGEKGAPREPAIHRGLILSQTRDYQSRATDVARLLRGSGILNVCGEWNAHSHYEPAVRARFNQSVFGAAYGVSALLNLMRSEVDAEMLWTGTDEACGYGVLDKDAIPTPLFHGRRLCAHYVRYGDWICFPAAEPHRLGVDVVVARGEDGSQNALFVHLKGQTASYDLAELANGLADGCRLLKIDEGTGNRVVDTTSRGTVRFDGYGVAVVTTGRD
jgi:beta-xylosidase